MQIFYDQRLDPVHGPGEEGPLELAFLVGPGVFQDATCFRPHRRVGQEEDLLPPDGGQGQVDIRLLEVNLQFFLEAGKARPLKNGLILEEILP